MVSVPLLLADQDLVDVGHEAAPPQDLVDVAEAPAPRAASCELVAELEDLIDIGQAPAPRAASCELVAEPEDLVDIGQAPTPLAASCDVEHQTPHEAEHAVAREALAYHATHGAPGATPPACWDSRLLVLVAMRVAQQVGDYQKRLREQKAAIDAAFKSSNGRPKPSYIWGQQEHWLEHLRRGQAALNVSKPSVAKLQKTPEEPPTNPETDAEEAIREAEARAPAEREFHIMALPFRLRNVNRPDLVARARALGAKFPD